MSRSGYTEDCDFDPLAHGRWRAQVASATRGKRGQAFFREVVEALDAMPEKRLIANELEHAGNVCTLGSVGLKRGTEMGHLDPHDYDTLSGVFGIPYQLVCEIEYMNDEAYYGADAEGRWKFMRDWAVRQLREPNAAGAA